MLRSAPETGRSGRRPGCPGRLPRNRTCAVRIRLFGMTGYYPRHRPVYDLVVPSGSISCAGALMAAQISPNRSSSVTSPRSAKYALRSPRSTSRIVAQRPDGLTSLIDASPRRFRPDSKPDEAAGDRSLRLPVLQHDRAQSSPNVRVRLWILCSTPGVQTRKCPSHPCRNALTSVMVASSDRPRDRRVSSRMRSRSRFSLRSDSRTSARDRLRLVAAGIRGNAVSPVGPPRSCSHSPSGVTAA